MKPTLLVIATVLCLACNTPMMSDETEFEYYTVDFVPNADLPYDCVEVAPIQPAETRFYTEQPKARPVGLPATFVLVSVFSRTESGVWHFGGWFWLDAELVNELHGSTPPSPENLVTL